MARGWDQGSGELRSYFFDLDKYWTKFRYVFADACRKRTTYKFALIKSSIDSLYISCFCLGLLLIIGFQWCVYF